MPYNIHQVVVGSRLRVTEDVSKLNKGAEVTVGYITTILRDGALTPYVALEHNGETVCDRFSGNVWYCNAPLYNLSKDWWELI